MTSQSRYDTGLTRRKHAILGNDPAMKQALAKQHVHGKLLEPEQVASVVTFLFTDGFMNSQRTHEI